MKLTNAARMRDADTAATHVEGVPSEALMENAAGHLARAALETMGTRRRCVVFCGAGNNGGDGVAAARLLLLHGVELRVLLVGKREKMTFDTREMERRLNRVGGILEDFDPRDAALPGQLAGAGAIVDAIFGIGLHRPVRGEAARAVRLMNESGTPIIAADIPSGVEADTGAVLGAAVRAARTVTFTMAKPGHFAEPGCDYCGAVEVRGIGLPESVLTDACCGIEAIRLGDVSLPRRPRLAHKGDFGKLLIVGGSVGYTGAPVLAARAALRAGAGLTSLGVPAAAWPVCAAQSGEAMAFPLPSDDAGRLTTAALEPLCEKLALCDTLVLGPGLGRSDETRALVRALLAKLEKPTLLDADALWALGEEPELLKKANAPLVLTPHAGEFRRLGGELTGVRLCDAKVFAQKTGCAVMLKGHRTICAFPNGATRILCAGNPGMAKGGSGDVLAGVVGALLGQLPWEQAIVTGGYVHAAAGDRCAALKGEYGMTPSDMIEMLPAVLRDITENA